MIRAVISIRELNKSYLNPMNAIESRPAMTKATGTP
jgi:hypothetical protein